MIKGLRDRTYLSVTVERMRDDFAKRISNIRVLSHCQLAD